MTLEKANEIKEVLNELKCDEDFPKEHSSSIDFLLKDIERVLNRKRLGLITERGKEYLKKCLEINYNFNPTKVSRFRDHDSDTEYICFRDKNYFHGSTPRYNPKKINGFNGMELDVDYTMEDLGLKQGD